MNIQTREHSTGPKAKPLLGRILIVLGAILIIATIPAIGLTDIPTIAAVIPVLIANYLIRLGKRLTATSANTILNADNRAPVLYLRSFNDEDLDKSFRGILKSINTPGDKDLATTIPAWGIREQDAFAHVFNKIGPYIAIGKPGEKMPELGAARMYVPDESWQKKVSELLSKAKLVILRAGNTEGLRWEVSELVHCLKPTQILFILPVKEENYSGFRAWANKILPVALPEEMQNSRLLTFNSEWQPVFLPIARSITKSLIPYLNQNGITLKETFFDMIKEKNGLRWK